jgi:hypothetical protein
MCAQVHRSSVADGAILPENVLNGVIMKKLIAGACFTVLGTIGVVAASPRTSVTITGCVKHGVNPNSYVLTSLAATSPLVQDPAEDIYWLTSTKGLHDQVGHKVQVTGLVSAEDDAGKTGKIKVQSSENGDEKIAVETPTNKAEAKVEAPVGTSGVVSRSEIVRPVRTLHVRSIKMLASSCP